LKIIGRIYYNILGREQRGIVIHDQEHSCPADFSRNETLTDRFAGFMGDHQIDPLALDEDHKAWAH
jgi:hypothetical protein